MVMTTATQPTETTARRARAVLYLRVSTTSQVNTDYDPEGISIPAQRQSCQRKAIQMGDVEIVGEYVEPGKSATSMDKRPAFQQMMARIRDDRDVDYVIIYKLSRMNRNRVDDAHVLMDLRQHHVTLVSATESIDETPVGQLMHGILASFNEFRSAEDGADIRYKMGEKAKRGGTLGRAPLGYLNVRERFEGREVRSVDFDPERSPYVRQAFELYATGDYTLETLADELTDRGLRTKPGRYPTGPVSASKIGTLLRDPYYLGVVTYKGEQYPGRHEALVSQELFDQVQIVLNAHSTAGERQRKHHHYLKGSLWCGPCHEAGRESRLLIQRSVGQGGTYFYFFCAAKQHKICHTPYMHIDKIEAAVAEHYATIGFTPEFTDDVRRRMREALDDQQTAGALLANQAERHLARLDRQEANLIDLAADGDIATTKVRQRLRDIAEQRAQLQGGLETTTTDLQTGADLLDATLDLLNHAEALYEKVDDPQRRLINQAVFEKLYIDADYVSDDQLREPFEAMVTVHRNGHARAKEPRRAQAQKQAVPQANLRDSKTKADLLTLALEGNGWSRTAMVEVMGFEPTASSMRPKRSSQLSYTPVGPIILPSGAVAGGNPPRRTHSRNNHHLQ